MSWAGDSIFWKPVDGSSTLVTTDALAAYDEYLPSAGPAPARSMLAPSPNGCGVVYRVALHPK